MRIALFTDTYLPQLNGVSRTLARLVAHLDRRGHEVFLVSPRVEETPAPYTVHHHRLAGVPVPVYPELLMTRHLDRKGKKLLEAFDPQVVHCATESTVGWSGRRWALRTGRPLVTSFHTNFPDYAREYGMGLLTPLAWSLLRRFHRPALRTLCPSEATLEELRSKAFHPRLGIWSRGVDSDLYSPARRSPEVRRRLAPDGDVLLLYVGRLAGEKRLDVLMEAFPKVRDASKQRVELVLVGDGPWGDDLRKRSEPGGHLTGYLTGTDLAEAYAAADIFVFASDTETFGNVVAEAMASALPVVGADRGGVRSTIDHGETGFRAVPGSADDFARYLLTLVDDEELRRRMGTEGRARAEGMSWTRILDGVVSVYEEVAPEAADSLPREVTA
jgi:phosphatidylinositol alpha 1,6-mannosyltransferase